MPERPPHPKQELCLSSSPFWKEMWLQPTTGGPVCHTLVGLRLFTPRPAVDLPADGWIWLLDRTLTRCLGRQESASHTSRSKVKHAIKGVLLNTAPASPGPMACGVFSMITPAGLTGPTLMNLWELNANEGASRGWILSCKKKSSIHYIRKERYLNFQLIFAWFNSSILHYEGWEGSHILLLIKK